jgi:hypothetical protein
MAAAFFPIPSSEFTGAIVVNAFAILSTLALFSIFVRVLWLGILRLLGENVAQTYFNTQLGYYAACLLIGNMINGIAGLMGLPFLVNHGITDNALCTSQAVVMQVGNIATAYFTVAIAFHTFNSLVLRKRQSFYVYGPTILIGWTFSLALAFIPLIAQMGPVYGPSDLSCGVRTSLPGHLFYFHLLPIFITAALSVILYTLIFLALRGVIVIRGVRIELNLQGRWKDASDSSYQQFVASIARSMLWYPAAYILFLVPYSVTRLVSLGTFTVPFQVVVFAYVCWFALGVVDAILLFNTFRVLGPAFEARPSTGSGSGYQREDLESFGTTETFKRFTSEVNVKGPFKVNLTDKMIKEYRGGDSSITSTSSYNPSDTTVSYPERAAGSYHIVSEYDLDRQISPVSILNQSIVVESPGSIIASHPPVRVPMTDHTRQASNSSSFSLPVPPRHTPTPSRLIIDPPPSSLRGSPIARPSPTQPVLTPRYPVPSPSSTYSPTNEQMRLSGVSVRSSATSGSVDVSGWLARQNPDGSMPSASPGGMRNQNKNQPMLSAVKPSFPPSVSSGSGSVDPTASAKARLRPLLLASVERTGSMVLAERYSKMYPEDLL